MRKTVLSSLLILTLVACTSPSRPGITQIPRDEVRETNRSDQSVKATQTVQSTSFVTLTVMPDILPTSEPGCQALLPAVIPEVDAANVRSGPGTSFEILGTLPPNQALSILEISQNGEWLHIPYGDRTGWIFVGVVRLGSNFSDITEQGMSTVPEGTSFDQAKYLAAIRSFTSQPELQLMFVRLEPSANSNSPDHRIALYVDCSGHRYWLDMVTLQVQE